jgi:hypothetical protein
MLGPGRHGWAELLTLVDAIRRLAYDRTLSRPMRWSGSATPSAHTTKEKRDRRTPGPAISLLIRFGSSHCVNLSARSMRNPQRTRGAPLFPPV